jgi:hypothetical protein
MSMFFLFAEKSAMNCSLLEAKLLMARSKGEDR